MNSAVETLPGVWQWTRFSPEHKVDLTSTLVALQGKLFCFDPISLAQDEMERLGELGTPEAIILTNDNHERDLPEWSATWNVPVWASPGALPGRSELRRFCNGRQEWAGWSIHPLAGAAPGEIALHAPALALMIFGDAMVNLPGRGLEILPRKYCRDQDRLRDELRDLASLDFRNAVMAHGHPLIGNAARRIGELLDGSAPH
jgi:glyoxylase-like metal-dependent hydrolase (beta-lactamase superfamily II)